ncbi:MAG: hypothetical protein HY753_02710, partial [Nitrospirae bacterium]|nr:hypothetical protein [Nitrospirota bacterium]
FDEAHKTVGKKDSLFSYLLHDKNIPIKKRMFMTATERHYRGQSEDIVSMDDPEIYGDTFELLSFKKALESRQPILSDYKIVTISVSRDEIASLIRENLFVKPDRGRWDREVEAEMLAAVIALRKAMKKYPIRHAVSFHSSIARAKAFKYTQDTFSKAFPAYGRLETFHVSGNTPTAVRSRELEEFAQAKRSLVTNARCLTEGVDVPNIDCVLFADPRKSTIDIVQAVGRALRTYKGKQFGYVIVPVLLDDDVTDIRSSQSKAFDSILMVLRALAANDERIIEYFRTVSQGRQWTGTTTPVDIDIPEGLVVDADEFINSIKLQFWSRLAKLSWRPFEEAREFVRGVGLRTHAEWRKYCEGQLSEKGIKPSDIPDDPRYLYQASGWISWGDWLGTDYIAHQFSRYRPFTEARAYVHTLDLKKQKEWSLYSRGKIRGKGTRPDDIPGQPRRVYKDKWKGWGDWLGTGNIHPRQIKWRPFIKAVAFVNTLGLKNGKEWSQYCKGLLLRKGIKPSDIPANPASAYKNKGWKGMGYWLGTGIVATWKRQYRLYPEARLFVHKLKLNSSKEWREYCRGKLLQKGVKPEDIPSEPSHVYKDEWKGWGDWLVTGTIAVFLRQYRPFKQARSFTLALGLNNRREWQKFCQGNIPEKVSKPDDIPSDPPRVYKNKGWVSWGNWLGTETVANKLKRFRPFEKARAYVHKLNLKNQDQWVHYCQGNMPEKDVKPDDIPKYPRHYYKDKGWASMGDWLGKKKK